MKCCVIRDNSGISGSFYPRFELRIDSTQRLLLTSKKRAGNWTGNYLITLDHENLEPSAPGYVGKLRSDYSRNIFNLYDDGANPGASGDKRVRENLAAILYDGHWHDSKGPRKMKVVIPLVEGEIRTPCVPLKVCPLYKL